MWRILAASLAGIAALAFAAPAAVPAREAGSHAAAAAHRDASSLAEAVAERDASSLAQAAAKRDGSSPARPARRRAKRVPRCSAAGIRAMRGTARVERQVRCRLNARRARSGLRPLRWDACLDRAAERHARDMVRRRYFAHSSRGGRTLAQRVRAAGYLPRGGRWSLGENLAWGAGRRATAAATVRGWLRSPPHRRNVLAPGFRDVGIAVVRGAPVPLPARARAGVVRATVVAEFGARQPGRCRR